jgi:hypothetical protein
MNTLPERSNGSPPFAVLSSLPPFSSLLQFTPIITILLRSAQARTLSRPCLGALIGRPRWPPQPTDALAPARKAVRKRKEIGESHRRTVLRSSVCCTMKGTRAEPWARGSPNDCLVRARRSGMVCNFDPRASPYIGCAYQIAEVSLRR